LNENYQIDRKRVTRFRTNFHCRQKIFGYDLWNVFLKIAIHNFEKNAVFKNRFLLQIRQKRSDPFYYRAMHFSAKRGIAIACRLSVRLSVHPSVCDVDEL